MATIEKRRTKEGFKYRARVRVEGNLIRTATFSSKTLAREWAVKTENELRNQKHIPDLNARNHTTGDSVPFFVRAQIMCPFLMFLYWAQSCNWDIYTLYHVSPMQSSAQYIYAFTATLYTNYAKSHHNTTLSPYIATYTPPVSPGI